MTHAVYNAGMDLDWQKKLTDYQKARFVDRTGFFDLIIRDAGPLPACVLTMSSQALAAMLLSPCIPCVR